MSKKHQSENSGSVSQDNMHAAEYRIIKFDLLKVVALNVVYLIVILSLYFANLSSHFLDKWFAKVLHF